MLTPAELTLLADEIQRLALPARIDKIHQPAPDRVVLRLSREGEERGFLIAAARGFARAHFVEEAPANPRTPSPFCEELRRLLMPGRIVAARTLQRDSVLVLDCEVRETGGRVEPRQLVAELFGAQPNILVTGAGGRILAVLVHREGKHRNLAVGERYESPARPEKELAPKPPFAWLPEPAGDMTLSRSLELAVTPRESESLLGDSRQSILTILRQQEKKLRKRLENIEGDFLDAEAIPRLVREGDLLKTHLGEIRRGMKSFVATEWREDGEQKVPIALDPKRTPQQEVSFRFDEARRLEGLKEAAEQRKAEVQERLAALASLIARAEAADSDDTLAAVREDAGIESKAPAAPGKKPAPKIEPRKPYRTFLSKDGIEILVGRTARDNDELTFHVANGNDFWFHVRDYPGSHVVIRAREQLPEETMLDAATLAVHFSRGESGGKRDVSWTRRKFVSKARGSPAGQVLLSSHKTIHLRVEPDRLARLLAPRSGSV